MRRPLFFITTALAATLITIPFLTASPSATAGACKDVEFIFARGSGGNVGEENYKIWESGIISTLEDSTLNYNFYELGTNSYNGARYPSAAIGVKNLSTINTSISAIFSALGIGPFNESVSNGVRELVGRIAFVSSSCPNIKFVLAGYSQGAMVMSRAVPKLSADKIAYVATFGDPTLYLPEGEGIIPPACRGLWYSDYRVYAPNCRTHAGMLGANKPYEPKEFTGKIGIWCTKQDVFCSNSINLSDIAADHLSYAPDGLYLDSAKKIREKLIALFPNAFEDTTAATLRNTVLLFDSTTSMQTKITQFKETALKIAADTLNNGGDVAVFEYRDIKDGWTEPRLLADFGSTYDEIKNAIDDIVTGGGDDLPESTLSAALHAMNTVKWKKGAVKSLVVVTDAPFHSPDLDGTTIAQVIRRSLEIDPVNFYVVGDDEALRSDFDELISGTNGNFFSLNSADFSLNIYGTLLSRPEANFPLEEYSGLIGDEFHFGLITSGNIVQYDWDLDDDGVFEVTTFSPTIAKTYPSTFSGIIKARVTDENGLSSTASASINVLTSAELAPSLKNVSQDQLTFSYTFGENTAAVLVSLDGLPLGVTTGTSFTLTDLTIPATIQLTPISPSGFLGTPSSFDLTPNNQPDVSIPLESPSDSQSDTPTSFDLTPNVQSDIPTSFNLIPNSQSGTTTVESTLILVPNSGRR